MDDKSKQFYNSFDDYLAWFMQEYPISATVLGVHDYDGRLADLSLSSLDNRCRVHRQYLSKFSKYLEIEDKSTAVDVKLAISMSLDLVREHEKLDLWRRMPGLYVRESVFGAYSLLAKDFAPLRVRLQNLISRLQEVSRVLEQGKANLTRPPKIWTEIAISNAKGSVSFFEDTVPIIASQELDMISKVVEASERAADAMKDFIRFLELDLMPRSDGEFAVGENLWNEFVRDKHMLDSDADRIERTGYRLIAETREAINQAAAEISPGRDPIDVLDDLRKQHPRPSELLDLYEKAMHRSRQFIIDHDLVTIPQEEHLKIQETPIFARPTIPLASYYMPGPFEKVQQGVFWVTPIDPELSEDELETRLRGHPYGKIPIIAVHEGYPGHHLQFVKSSQAVTLPRKVGRSALLIEGWAFYCEEMMEQQGFLADASSRMLRLADQLWRACRIIIDVGIHVREMSIEDAVRILVDTAGLEKPDAISEVNRYTLSPTQPMCCLIGKMEIMNIVEDYKAAKGANFSLKGFHDDLLSLGALPPELIRTLLL